MNFEKIKIFAHVRSFRRDCICILFLCLALLPVLAKEARTGRFLSHKVEAPFPMPEIREYVFPDRDFLITDYGADTVRNNPRANSNAIAKAMKACSKAGGGRVVVPAGMWRTGPIHFRSNVNLYLAEGATVRFSDDPELYLPAVETTWEGMECYNYSPLVYAYGCENVAITGKGTLAPEMETWRRWFSRPKAHMDALHDLYMDASTGIPVKKRQMAKGENHMRPHLIQFNRCTNVLLDGFRIRESPFWTIHMYLCRNGIARNLDVRAHGHNNDGIDIDMSRDFLVENCVFDQGDDAVVIKSGRNQDAWRLATPSENIVVRNCKILAGHVLLGIGSEISGGVRNVYMHDCEAPVSVHRLFFVKTNHRRGGFVENIYMDRVKTGDVISVLEIDTEVLYQWKNLVPTLETRLTKIAGIHISNVECGNADMIYDLKGNADLPVTDVTIENVKVGTVRKGVSNVVAVEDLKVSDVTWDVEQKLVVNGVPWFDSDGNIINAHGACIVKDGGKYWLFGEYKSDESNAFPGFGCYSSDDLVNWKFERVVLPVQKDGILGPDRVGERVKVMKCPGTGEYIMLMHADNLQYKDPNIGIAVSDRINGDYTLLGTIEYDGKPIKRWDMGTFQDEDGTGYLLIHHGPIYRLSDDYRSIAEQVADVKGMGESPAMFKKNGTYYLLTSNLTSWERNDNYYFSAPSVRGPWKKRGLFCPEGTLTHNSQSTFVFPLEVEGDTIPMYMGDRWSYPHQASAATYVWQPIVVESDSISIPEFWPAWNAKTATSVSFPSKRKEHDWKSDKKGDTLRIPFYGRSIKLFGHTNVEGGYAIVRLKDKSGKTLHSSYVDFYSKVPDEGIRFVSRDYPQDNYVLEVEVSGEHPVWSNKRGDRFGSTGYTVSVTSSLAE